MFLRMAILETFSPKALLWIERNVAGIELAANNKAAVMPIIEDKIIYGSSEPFRPADKVIVHKTPWQLAARLDK